MALEGTFRDFGLADIFQLVGLQKKTGVLTVRGEEGRLVTVSFDAGMVVFADEFRRTEAERLGSVLMRTRRIDRKVLEEAIEEQKSTSQRLGYILVGRGIISQQELRQALQLQVKETVYRLFRWKQGSYHFSPEPVTYDREIYLPLAAEFVLMEGIRMIDEWPIIERKIPSFAMVFERVPGAELPGEALPGAALPGPGAAPGGVASTGAGDDLEDLLAIVEDEDGPPGAGFGGAGGGRGGGEALGPKEAALLGLVDGRRSVQDLIDIGQHGEFETCKMLYAMLSLGLIRAQAVPEEAPEAAAAPRRRLPGAGEYVPVAVAVLALLAGFLFNPWGVLVQSFRARESRLAAAALQDAARLQRLRLALEVYYLEKQTFPAELADLAASRLVSRGEIRSHAGEPFDYRGAEKEYRLDDR